MGHDEQILKIASPFAVPGPVAVSEKAVEPDTDAFALLGESAAVTQLKAHVRRVAPYFRSLSLTGERGCGERVVAQMLHKMCPLQELKFVELDAIEAERRFVSGGVATVKEGLLYLPEAEQLSRAAQEGLLRLLRSQAGQSVRVVVFAGPGLKPYMSARYFLPELAGSLGSLRMTLPPLRERGADVPTLMLSWLEQHRSKQAARGVQAISSALSETFLDAARQFAWPGNLPQMDAAMAWLVGHRAGEVLEAHDLTAALEAGGQEKKHPRDSSSIYPPIYPPIGARLVTLDSVVQEHVRSVLVACNGNKLKTAEVLGISRSTLYRMLDAGESVDFLMAG